MTVNFPKRKPENDYIPLTFKGINRGSYQALLYATIIMEIRIANNDDIEDIFSLHKKNHFDRVKISEKNSGFVRIPLDLQTIGKIVNLNYAAICKIDNKIVGYYLFAGEGNTKHSSYLKKIINEHTNLVQENILFGTQACIDKNYRKQGIGRLLFEFIVLSVPVNKIYLFGSVTKQNTLGYEYSVNGMGGNVIFEDPERFYVLFELKRLRKNISINTYKNRQNSNN